jgi:hypothetical protein
MVGLIPILGVEILDKTLFEKTPNFVQRMRWFLKNRPDLAANVICPPIGDNPIHIFSVVTLDHLSKILKRLCDSKEFLSSYGIRSLSKYHEKNPFTLTIGGHTHVVNYEPKESTREMFGGNSNWRGPIWFPINYLIIEALKKFHGYLGESYKIVFPTDTGTKITLEETSKRISKYLIDIFLPNKQGKIPVNGDQKMFQLDPLWNNYHLFYEYFCGNCGRGLGASHQTGWTGLVAKLIHELDQ